MRIALRTVVTATLVVGTISACAEPVDRSRTAEKLEEIASIEETEAEPVETEESDVAEAGEATDVKRLDCEPLGDSAVWVETGEDGDHTLVTHLQSEMAPDAEPSRMALEATGASAGREGSRFSDENGEYIVWIMDDGTATVMAGENEVSCPAA